MPDIAKHACIFALHAHQRQVLAISTYSKPFLKITHCSTTSPWQRHTSNVPCFQHANGKPTWISSMTAQSHRLVVLAISMVHDTCFAPASTWRSCPVCRLQWMPCISTLDTSTQKILISGQTSSGGLVLGALDALRLDSGRWHLNNPISGEKCHVNA